MAHVTLDAGEVEEKLRTMETATAFRPRSTQLNEVVAELADTVSPKRLKLGLPEEKRKVLLAAASSQLEEVAVLIRGYRALAREHKLYVPSVKAFNLVKSLISSGHTLDVPRLKAEFSDLREMVAEIAAAAVSIDSYVTDTMNAPQNDHPMDLSTNDLGLEFYSGYSNKMPGPKSPEITMLLDLPVIATFNRGSSERELNSRGFDVTQVANYIVFRKVTILGVNTTQCVEKGYDQEAVVKLVLGKLSEILNYEIGLMCDQAAFHKKGGWAFYWYGPVSNIDRLGGKLDGRLCVTQFQFPFD